MVFATCYQLTGYVWTTGAGERMLFYFASPTIFMPEVHDFVNINMAILCPLC
jgi:hypothetical protein